MSFSVAGMSTWPQGVETAAEIIDQRSGLLPAPATNAKKKRREENLLT